MTYDPAVDALAIDLDGASPGASARTEALDDLRLLDYDAGGRLISIDLMDVSRGVDLDGLPEREVVAEALRRLAAEQGWPAG
jgi:hypothetical protein